MKTVLYFLTALVMSVSVAHAQPWRVEQRDVKLPSQKTIEKDSRSAPVADDGDRILNDQSTSSSSTTEVTSFLAQPDVCRAVSVTPGGTTADVPAGDVTVAGTNKFGESISEGITLSANQSSEADGAQAFCSVTKVTFPQQDGGNATYDVGVNDKLGLKRCMDGDEVLKVNFGGTHESTRPTVASDADEVSKNTVDLNSALDGSNDVDVYYMQNYRCH